MMNKYRAQREQRKTSKLQSQQPAMQKRFAEDEEEKKVEQPALQVQAQAQPMAAAASEANVQPAGDQKKSGGFLSSLKSAFSFGAKKDAEAGASNMALASADLEIDRNLSCEEMDSDDLGGDLNLSDQEDGADERAFRRNYKQSKRAVVTESAAVYKQEFDTNVFEVKLDCLANKGQVATGDAELCTKCQAVFN
mmetsp:Transcript_19081/g.25833  ORF Transcript_19081/g.25833 Transcript_19081/m.25833 type:complete len:194 (+) Transcript_19081:82-663(+)